MSRTSIAALALAVVGFAASGCGSSSKQASSSTADASSAQPASSIQGESSHSQTGSSKTPESFVAQANAICRSANAKRAAYHVTQYSDYARYLPQVAAIENAETAELAKLDPPSSLAGGWRKMLAYNKLISANTLKFAKASGSSDKKEARAVLAVAQQAEQKAQAIARRGGLTGCTSTSS